MDILKFWEVLGMLDEAEDEIEDLRKSRNYYRDLAVKTSADLDAVPVSVIESWLFEIALNNTKNYLSYACEEIISRLDGLKRYYREEFCTEQMPRVDNGIEWHKVTIRPLTEEEIAYYEEIDIEAEEIFDCEMPDDGQEILVATKWGVDKDICCSDPDYGIGLEGRGDWDGVLAWAEMPEYVEETE